MKVTAFRKIYKASRLAALTEGVAAITQGSYVFKKRDYFQGKRVECPEVLNTSKIFSLIQKVSAKIRPKKYNRVLEYFSMSLFFVIFLFTPLKSWIKTTYPMGGVYTFIVPVLLVIIAICLFLRGKKESVARFTLVDIGIMLMVVSLVSSSAVSMFVYGQTRNVIYEGFIWLSYLAIFYIGRSMFTTKKALTAFLSANFVLVFILAGIGILQYFLGVATPQWIEGFETIRTRAFSTLDNPIILSGYINIFFFIALGVFFGIGKLKYKLLMVPLFFVLVLALGLTFSRGGWIGFVVGLLFFFVIYNPKQLLFGVPVALMSLIFIPKEYFYRLLAVFDSRYSDISAVSGRIWTLNNVFHILPDHLLLGVGPGMYGGETAFKTSPSIVYMEGIQGGAVPMQNTDNQFLQVIIQQGLVGILAFVFFVGVIFYTGIVVYQKLDDKFLKMLALGITASAVAFFTQGLFADVLQFPQMSLMMFGFLGTLITLKKPKLNNFS